MTWTDIVPLENEGMSVITAIFFLFAGAGIAVLVKYLTSRLDDQDIRINNHDSCVDELRGELAAGRVQFAEVKGTISQTQIVVDRIDSSLSDIAKTNARVIEVFLDSVGKGLR